MDRKHLALSLFLLALFWPFLWILFSTHILAPDIHGNLLTGESTYGDLPFHLSSITQIAYGRIFPPENPFFAGGIQAYPFNINLISAFLVLLGMSPKMSIVLPGLGFSLVMILILYFFYFAVSKDKKAS